MRGLLLLALMGCSSATPESACARLLSGIREGDGAQVFDALLKSTRHSFYTVAQKHNQMRALIERDYPVEERRAALSRLLDGSSKSGQDLFVRLYTTRLASDFQRRMGNRKPIISKVDEDQALCPKDGKEPFHLARDEKGRWGLSEFEREWDQAKLRAVHDLETVSDNARHYRQARP